MANTTISALTAATTVSGTDLIPIVQGGTTKKATVSLLPSLTVQDENGNVGTAVTQIDFQGAGVAATAGTGEIVVTIGTSASAPRNPHPEGQNLKGWSFDPMIVSSAGAAATSQDVLYLAKILTPQSISISNVLFVIGATATTDTTGFYAAIILPDGSIARQSADISTTVNATAANTLVTAPLSSAVTVGGASVTDFVYAAIGYDSATTSPTMFALGGSAANNSAVNAGLVAGTRRHGTLPTTTWPLSGTLSLASAGQAASPKNIWMAVS